MRTLAICAEHLAPVTRAASGVEPLTSPPLTSEWVRPGMLSGYDFLYLKLYGIPGQPQWFGDRLTPAIRDRDLAEADLSHTIVFLAGNRQECQPMIRALEYAEPRAIVVAREEGQQGALSAVDVLGLYYRKALGWLKRPRFALAWTKARALLAGPRPARRAARLLILWRCERCT